MTKGEKNIYEIKGETKKALSLSVVIFGVAIFSFLFLISFVSAEEFGYNYLVGELNVVQAINYTQINVNNSLLWDGNAYDEDRWVFTTGDTMTGTLFLDSIGLGLDVLNSADIGNHLTVGDNLIVDTNTLFVDSVNKRVGIGTIIPQNTLNVIGDGNFTGLIYGNGSQLTGISLSVPDVWVNITGDNMTGDLTMNTGARILFDKGSESLPPISSTFDSDTGFYPNLAGQMQFISNGVKSWQFKGNSLVALPSNSGRPRIANTIASFTVAPYSFQGDTNTGMGWANPDVLNLITGGKTAISIDATQEVGIGTTTPSELLHLERNTNDGTIIRVDNDAAGQAAFSATQLETTAGHTLFSIMHGEDRTGTRYGITFGDYGEILLNGGDGLIIGTGTAGVKPIIFGGNSFEIARFTDDMLGIGTTTPFEMLEIQQAAGTARISLRRADSGIGAENILGGFLFTGDDTVDPLNEAIAAQILGVADGSWAALTNFHPGRLEFYTESASSSDGLATPHMVIKADGTIGIGTTNPQNKLNIVGDGNFTGNLTTTNIIPEINNTYDLGNSINIWQKIWANIGNFLGDVFIGGDLNVTKNITSWNVFIPQYVFVHTDDNISVLGAGVWTNVTFDQEPTAILYGIINDGTGVSNTTFTMTEDGIYEFDFNYDMEDNSPSASDIDVAGRVIYSNGTEVDGSVFELDIIRQGYEVELSHDFLVVAKAGDSFVFQFIASDSDVRMSTHGAFGDHPDSASVVIKKISNIL